MKAPLKYRLAELLRDWKAIDGHGGPGAYHDGKGSWHLFCHLAAAAAVLRVNGGGVAWVGTLFNANAGEYQASMCRMTNGVAVVQPLASHVSTDPLKESALICYLEGASRGRILDREANDEGDSAKVDRRQDYDRNPASDQDGGPVWEMWTVSRDIRETSKLGDSLVVAYCDLLSVLGGEFAAVVARGRIEPEYGHLYQMCAMIDAEIIKPEQAVTEIKAAAIPTEIEQLLLDATPDAFARCAEMLANLTNERRYWMYGRKVSSFIPTPLLRKLVKTLSPAVQ